MWRCLDDGGVVADPPMKGSFGREGCSCCLHHSEATREDTAPVRKWCLRNQYLISAKELGEQLEEVRRGLGKFVEV